MNALKLPKEVFIVLALLLVVGVMLVPVAPIVIDFGIYTSCLLACFVLTISVMVKKPAEFLTFPVVLIFSVVFRLGLNVASTRMIIQNGSTDAAAAGNIINSVASIVIGGELITGLLIFFILLVVNLVVINKGASRMAEVGARFTLDGVPGRQMAIDADLAAGSITHEEAKLARETLQTETSFYGSLDGAAKFIKGDATAGVVITLLNLFVGVSVAVFAQGNEFSAAFKGVATLTIGDGIANQIPAVLISVAGAILLSRSGAQSSLSDEFWAPVRRYKELVYLAALVALVSNIFPGVPHILSIPLTGVLVWLATRLWRRRDAGIWEDEQALDAGAEEEEGARDVEETDERPSVVTLKISSDLAHLVTAANAQLHGKIEGIKTYLRQKYGLYIAPVSVGLDPELEYQAYSIHIHGSRKGTGKIGGSRFALDAPPSDEEEPVFGLKGAWAPPQDDPWSSDQTLSEYEVIATHLLHVLEANLSALLSIHDCRQMIKAFENEAGLETALPEGVNFDDVFRVCKEMLEERMSISALSQIIETVYLKKGQNQSKGALFEEVRRVFAHDVVDRMQQFDGLLYAVTLAAQNAGEGDDAGALISPNALSQFMTQFQELLEAGSLEDHVVLVERHLRKHIFQLLKSMQIDMHVLAFDDVPFAQGVKVSHQMSL